MMIPENELGVVVEFARQAEQAGFEIISIRSPFPDASIKRGAVTYRAEFEYKASNFNVHKHDPRKCDIIICWENDWPGSVLPVLALSGAEWKQAKLALPTATEREVSYWKQRALRAERKRGKTRANGQGQQSKAAVLDVLLSYLDSEPKASLAQAGREIKRSKSTVANYTGELIDTGRLVKNGQGWEVIDNAQGGA